MRRSSIPTRLLLRADAVIRTALRVEQAVREEILWAFTDPQSRDAATAEIFSAQRTYAHGGSTFEAGLFRWEERALDSDFFPKRGHVLVGGAGGGREVVALARRGYRVSAFEPSDLVESARRAAIECGNASVVRGSYEDFVHASGASASPLSLLLEGNCFDAIVLGWASLSHVHELREIEAIFSACRRVAPRGPVLCSFFDADELDPRARLTRVRRGVRRVIAPRSDPDAQRTFLPWAGFITMHCEPEIRRCAEGAGYEVARYDRAEYPHALLVPRAAP